MNFDNLSVNLAFDVVAFILFVILFFVYVLFYLSREQKKDNEKGLFLILIILGIAMSALEIIESCLIPINTTDKIQGITNAVAVAYDILVVFMAWVFSHYIHMLMGDRNFFRVKGIVDFIILIVMIVIGIGNRSRGWLFTFNEVGEEVPGPLLIVEYLFPGFIFLTTAIYFIINRHAVNRKTFVTNFLFFLFPAVGIVTEIISYSFLERPLLMAPFGCAIACLVVLMIIETPDYVLLLEAEKNLTIARKNEEDARLEAEDANKAKSRFLANMTHEIRTPINAIMGLDEIILSEADEENTREYALKIRSASESLLHIVNDVLDFSKLESGRMKITETEYSLAEMLLSLYVSNLQEVENKGIDFLLEIDETIPKYLVGDDIHLKQILSNLLSNAVKFTEQGHVILAIRRTEEDTYQFSVEDTGIGFKQEQIGDMSGEFVRFENDKQYGTEGSGLGLSISEKLLDRMGSRLEVVSEYQKGSTFSFVLKQLPADREPIGDIKQYIEERMRYQKKEVAQYRQDAKILVVDDTEINLFVVKKLLEKSHMQVLTCSSGQECLDLVQREAVDVILMDHMMPGMDGVETRQRLLELECAKDIPVIALTASTEIETREMFLDNGFVDFLTKPIEYDKLEEAIQKQLENK